jgi:type I restriction enzyme S subunit
MKYDKLNSTEFKITNEALNSSSANLINKGTVIIATRVGLGKVCIAGTDVAINQDLKAILPYNLNLLSNRFLFYFFKAKQQQIINAGTGFTVQGIKLDFLRSIMIPIPTLFQQQSIISKLDQLSDSSNKLQEAISSKFNQLNELKQNLLHQAFSGNL